MNKLYPKLAGINIKNNKQFYLPYLLTGMVSVAMFYLVVAMQDNPGVHEMPGGSDITMLLGFGIVVVGLFAAIFLFYTNSFIMKRRKKELGVYNILGMEKKHIAKVLFLETVFTGVVTIGGGLAIGILFSKLMTMLLYRLTGLTASIPFRVSGAGVYNAVVLFALVYAAALLYNLMQIKLANPIELLHSTNAGEREPKTKILLTLIGLLTLGGGYYMALTVGDAVSALTLFFVAVLLVIVGTYCLFTAGSIALLKLLRRNKKYYYQAKHFTTVSGMIYRMKQNAVGLANICILSTMVLVTVSTTVSLYLGVDDALDARFPTEVSATTYFKEMPQNKAALAGVITDTLKQSGRVVTAYPGYLNVSTTAVWKENSFSVTGIGVGTDYDIADVVALTVITRADYEAYTGEAVMPLAAGEAVIAATRPFEESTVQLEESVYTVKQVCDFPQSDTNYLVTLSGGAAYLILPDDAAFAEAFTQMKQNWNSQRVDLNMQYNMGYDIDGTADEKLAAEAAVRAAITDWQNAHGATEPGYAYTYMDARQESYDSFYRLYGGLLFLGLFLGTMFLMVTVLIIFYKQISEGYDDKERYAIMEKVGMSNAEVKRAIRSQVLTVFFLPIVVAVIHVAMAFPMITLLLECLNLMNTALFAVCVAGTAVIFGIIYLCVYLFTSRSYYKIVGNQV